MNYKDDKDYELIAELYELGYYIDPSGNVIGKRSRRLKIHTGTSGYQQVNVYKKGKQKTYLIHRLVALKYIPNPNNLPEVNHIDGDKLNNHYKNLEWCTRPANIQHGFDTGLITPPWKGKRGKLHPRGKTVQQIKNGEIIEEFGSIREAGLITGIHRGTIDQVLSGKGKTAGGFHWKYKQ